MVLGFAPLNVLTLVFASGMVPRYLAIVAMAMAVTQYFAMKHVRNLGVKII